MTIRSAPKLLKTNSQHIPLRIRGHQFLGNPMQQEPNIFPGPGSVANSRTDQHRPDIRKRHSICTIKREHSIKEKPATGITKLSTVLHLCYPLRAE
mmetsp:Transcript_3583/g.9586  ORF Transcript_3583/g.9586 Transcript_3583/m.9586 type:complete len:96 (-) Transcript_3583:1483-1770(-)